MCGVLEDGEIVLFDKAYVDFVHLYDLDERGVFWVSRAKDNPSYRVVENLRSTSHPSVLCDQVIELIGSKAAKLRKDGLFMVRFP